MKTYKLFDKRYETYLVEETGVEFVTPDLDDAEDQRWKYLRGSYCPEFVITIHEFQDGELIGEIQSIMLN
jgi:hypothetical protein